MFPAKNDDADPSTHRSAVNESSSERPKSALQNLKQSFAELLGRTVEVDDDTADDADSHQIQSSVASGHTTPGNILEAMLFVGNEDSQPLTSQQVAEVMRGVEPREIDQLVQDLNRQYTEEDCPYRIDSVDDGYRMVLREEFSRLRDRFYGRIRRARLSQTAIDVLAIVAYNQPTARYNSLGIVLHPW